MSDICIALTFDFDGMSNWIANGASSPSMVSRGEFGPIGLLRILDLLDRHDLPATFFIPGHTALAFPGHCREIADAGHEIGHHGWVHENPVRLTPAHEREVLMKGIELLQETTGTRPLGYRSPAWDISPETIPLLIEHGFLYDSSLMGNDFSPYWARVGDGWSQDGPYIWGEPTELVEIPVAWHLDDFPYFEYVRNPQGGVLPGNGSPERLEFIWTEEFTYLREEVGAGLLTLTMHPQVIGRGHRIRALDRMIRRFKSHDGVRFVRLQDYAASWKQGRTPHLPQGAGH